MRPCKHLLLFISVVIFSVLLVQFLLRSEYLLKEPAQDFEVLYLAGRQVASNPYLKVGKDIFRSPPPSLLLFTLISIVPILQSQILWFIFSLFSFAAGSVLLFLLCRDKFDELDRVNKWIIVLVYLSLSLRFFPFRHDLGSGQINSFLFLLLSSSLFLQIKNKNFLSSGVLSLAIVLKLTPLFFLLPLLLQKMYKNIFFVLLGLISLILFSLLMFGTHIFEQYLTATNSYFDLNVSSYYNQSLVGVLNRMITGSLVQYLYWIALVAYGTLFVAKFSKFRDMSRLFKIVIWNVGTLTILIFSPFAWQYHFTIAIIPLFTSFYLILSLKMGWRALIVVMISYLLIGWNFSNPVGLQKFGLLGLLALSHVFFGTIILLALNYRFLFRQTQFGKPYRPMTKI